MLQRSQTLIRGKDQVSSFTYFKAFIKQNWNY